MKVQKRDATRLVTVLTGMVVNDRMIALAAPLWRREGFRSEWADRLAQWCVDHFREYGKAINRGVMAKYEEWASRTRDDASAKAMSLFLEGLSSSWEMNGEYQVDYAADLYRKLLNRRAMEKLKDDLDVCLDANEDVKALNTITEFAKVELISESGTTLWGNEKEIIEAMTDGGEGNSLVRYKGDLGRFFHNCLERDSLVAFAAPQKVGKTTTLIDLAYRSLIGGRRVAFFGIGDLTMKQVKQKFLVRAAGWPNRSDDNGWPMVVKKPLGIKTYWSEDSRYIKKFDLDTVEKTFDGPLSGERAVEAAKRLLEARIKRKKDMFWLNVFPNLSVSIEGIKQELTTLEVNGWGVPDVVVIDYADNLLPIKDREESRDQINRTWKTMSGLRMEKHCCLITATQVKAAAFNVDWMDRSSFAEDNRKLNHVTAMIGINQKPEEKDQGVCRLNYIVKREGSFNPKNGVYVAGCPAVGNPFMKSSW